MPHRVRETLLAGLLLASLLFLFFGKTLFTGQVLSAADSIFSTPFFSEVAPPGFTQAANPLLFDQVYQFVPWRRFAWESIRQGHLPLWNPYSLSGTPFVATMQAAVFYPINLLLTILPFEYTFVWSAILRLWIAGIFTYLLVRRYGLRQVASLIGAISFMLSGFLIVWLGHPHTNVAVWLPALILLADLLVQAPSKGKLVRSLALLALIIGIQFTGGHIETSVDILFAFGLYYLLQWTRITLPQRIPSLAKLRQLVLFPVLAVMLGTGLAAAQLFPFAEWLFRSAELHHRASKTFQLVDTSFWQHLLSLPVLVFPNIYNNPTWDHPYWSFLPWGNNYNENTLYVGILTLIFALVALGRGRASDQPLIMIWAAIGLLSLGRAFHLPLFDWLNQLPGLSLAASGRLRLVASFSLCVLAGFGAQALWDACSHNRGLVPKLWVRLCGVVALAGLIIAIGSNITLPLIKDRVIAYGRHLVDVEYAERSTHSHSLEYYYLQVDKMADGLLAAFRIENLAMYTPAILALAGLIIVSWGMRHYPRKPQALKIMLLFLVIVDLISFGFDYNPSIPVENFYPDTSIVSYITHDETLFRFTALRQDLVPDAHMMFGLSDIRGLEFPTFWYNQYLDLVPDRIQWLRYGAIFASVDSPLLRVLNIKYILASQPNALESSEGMRLIQKQGDIYLAEIIDVQPRGYMVYDAIVADSDDQALQMLRDAPDAVFDRVVLSSVDDNAILGDIMRHRESSRVSEVSVISYEPNQAIWRVVTSEGSYLFTSDTYYPGWKAYLDGYPTTLYRANVAFRAVHVPKGEHVVVFRYEPLSVLMGVVTGSLSLLAILAMLNWTRRELPKHRNGNIAIT